MTKNCPDCHGELEKGCILDQGYGVVTVERYARADVPDAKKNVIFGPTEEKFYDMRKVVTYRCTACNRLFSYAQETVLASDVGNTAVKNFLIVFGILMALAAFAVFLQSV